MWNILYISSGNEFYAIICCCLLKHYHSSYRLLSQYCCNLAHSCRYALYNYWIACAGAQTNLCILKTSFVSQTKRPDYLCMNIKTPSLCWGKELRGRESNKIKNNLLWTQWQNQKNLISFLILMLLCNRQLQLF